MNTLKKIGGDLSISVIKLCFARVLQLKSHQTLITFLLLTEQVISLCVVYYIGYLIIIQRFSYPHRRVFLLFFFFFCVRYLEFANVLWFGPFG